MPNRVWCDRVRRPRRRPRRGRGWGRPRGVRLRRRLGLGCVFISGRRGGFGRVLDSRAAGRRRERRGGRRWGWHRALGEARRRRKRRRGGSVAAAIQSDRERDADPGEGQDSGEDGETRPEAHLLHAGIDHAPEPGGPAGPLTHDKARYMGIRGRTWVSGAAASVVLDRADFDRAQPGGRVLISSATSGGPSLSRRTEPGRWTPMAREFYRTMSSIIGVSGCALPSAGSAVRARWSPGRRPEAMTGPVMPWLPAGSMPADRVPAGPMSHNS